MRLRFGLLIGFGIGYVLGSKAGRERYDQIRSLWSQVSGSEPARQISTEVRHVATRASEAIESKAAEGVAKVTEMVRGGDDAAGRTPPN